MSSCALSVGHYADLLRAATGAGYSFRLFSAPESPGRAFYMRHDVDLDVFAARDMARLEAEAGVQATYFLMPTSCYYNLWSVPVREAAQEIESLGGDVQLHFDAGPFADLSMEALEEEIATQARWLGDLLGGKEITAVSFHRPLPAVVGTPLRRFTSTYAPRYFSEMRYISDSAGAWRDGCVCGLLGREERIHCLVHPIWWMAEGTEVPTVLGEFLARNVRVLDGWLRGEIRSYRD